MKRVLSHTRTLFLLILVGLPVSVWAAEIDRFVGRYVGSAEEVVGQEAKRRDMSAEIEATKKGFTVDWTSVTYKSDGRTKEKTYSVEFVPSRRANIYGSAMKVNVFGKPTPLDPLQGEPFVWARFEGDTFSVFSMFINEEGDYELQEFHRTLASNGLNLSFRRMRDGVPEKEISAFLKRQK